MNNATSANLAIAESAPCLARLSPGRAARYPSLFSELVSRETLVSAARAVFASILRSPDAAEVIEQIDVRLALFLEELEAELREHRYTVGVILNGWKTHEGRLSRTRLLSLKDRIVHTALFIVLERALGEYWADFERDPLILERVRAAIRQTVLNGSNERNLFAVEPDRDPSEDLYLELLRMIAHRVLDEELRELIKLFIRAPSLDTPLGVAMVPSWRTP